MEQRVALRGLGAFLVIWGGQVVSMIGSGLTHFALGVYVYQTTGSATLLGLVLVSGSLPNLLAPFAGALVDRWDRRWVMILSDTGAGLLTLAIWLLLASGTLRVWHIYVNAALGSLLGIFQRPAHMATTTLLVPKQHYGRAAGLTQLGAAVSQSVSPILAGFLVVAIQVQGVVLVDLATYLVAVLTLVLVRIPRPQVTADGRAGKGSLLREAGYGWVYLRQRPGLLGMLILFAFINFGLSFFGVLFTPLILSFATSEMLGTLLSIGGIGMLAGGMAMSTGGGSRRKVHSLMGSMFLFGLALCVAGLRTNPWLIGAAVFSFFALLPVASGSSQAIWLAKVAPDVQGRVFAMRGMIAWIAQPLAYMIAGPLADNVFEPLMAADGALAGVVGRIVGVGPGRGIGLIFVTMGLFISLATAVGYMNPRIRLVEEELPDHVAAAAGSVDDLRREETVATAN